MVYKLVLYEFQGYWAFPAPVLASFPGRRMRLLPVFAIHYYVNAVRPYTETLTLAF